jgi:probable F420-dependent oxidoreductase
VIELAVRAERGGFSHVWTFDSHLLWQEPFVIYSQILARTERVVVGPMVTNPGTRDWTVIASQFATLNEMYGNRTVCGIGRGDSALRTLGAKPGTIDEMKQCTHVVRELACGRPVTYRGRELQLKWVEDGALEVWVAAYGPKALQATGEVGDGYILQLADPDIAAWMIEAVRRAAAGAGRDPGAITFCVAAPAYVGDDLAHQRDQTRWFGGMVGNHVADIVSRYGAGGAVPAALTDYIKAREGYDYAEHGRAGNPHADFVPDAVIDRFCVLGPVENHLARLKELRDLGVDQFAVYLQHDDKPGTLSAYADHIIPALS